LIHRIHATAAIFLLAACNAPAVNQVNRAENDSAAAAPDNVPPAPSDTAIAANAVLPDTNVEGPAPGTPGGLPDDRTPLEEPNGPIDPKSAEGAGQVVQHYGALLEQRKFADARKLWGNGGKASGLTEAQFIAAYDKYAAIHSEVGKPTDMEGAAGSSYITVPFHLYGTLKSGGPFNLVGPLTLRRVNDVPGSTEAQRRWHIEQSGMKPRP
jgi:hypothetical protein